MVGAFLGLQQKFQRETMNSIIKMMKYYLKI